MSLFGVRTRIRQRLHGWLGIKSPSQVFHSRKLDRACHEGFVAGMGEYQRRTAEIDKLPEPERAEARNAYNCEVMARARLTAARHLLNVPLFANPLYSGDEEEWQMQREEGMAIANEESED